MLEVCKKRGWSLRWDARLAQLACESAEFSEAVRGKRGDKVEEAGDVLIAFMGWTESAGIPWGQVIAAADRKCRELEQVGTYAGEQREQTFDADDVFANTPYGRAAYRKFGVVENGFRIYAAEWQGDIMKVSGAVFQEAKIEPGTECVVYLTKGEINETES